MINSCQMSLMILYLSLQLFMVPHLVVGIEFPPLDAPQKSFLQAFQLEDNISFDLPALYTFGDALVDPGNNNYLKKSRKANALPYGIDFNHTATGRFSNGRTLADFIARIVGLPFPLAYLGMLETEKKITRTGISFASASSGILEDSGLDEVVSLGNQINLFEGYVQTLKSQFNSTEDFAQYLSKSLFLLVTANSDLGWSYKQTHSKTMTVEALVKKLIEELSTNLERLYKLGARKIFVTTAFPLGCTPIAIQQDRKSTETPCAEQVNERAKIFNRALPNALTELQSKLLDSKINVGDLYKIYMDVIQAPSSLYGITKPLDSCCYFCDPGTKPCDDRNEYVFYDVSHPTEVMHFIITKRLFNEPSLCNPTSLIDLIQA